MKRLGFIWACLLCATLFFIQCKDNTKVPTLKFHANDPFQQSITPSQLFQLTDNEDNVIEGQNGTIIVMPKACFKNAKGKIILENIKVELTEALSLDEMLLSNLTTTSKGQLLETDGMIYFNASANGEQLFIDQNNPIYIEIPTEKRKSGMQAYEGIRDEMGNIDWVNPKVLESYLVAVNLDLLNFYPAGFENAVQAGLPFRKHAEISKALVDSLYYSLSSKGIISLTQDLGATDYNEPYNNKNKQVVNGRYTDDSYELEHSDVAYATEVVEEVAAINCGISPASIKVIKSNAYQNSLISTREFETRLQSIFQTCDDEILEIYVKNLDKNMWELDSMAAEQLIASELYCDFEVYYKQRLGKVKDGDKRGELLRKYYESALVRINDELEQIQAKATAELEAQNKMAEQTADEYKALLLKRESYRMETYGFEWSNTGWINIDNGTLPKAWEPQKLEVLVKDGAIYDRIYTYVVYTSIQSLYRLNSSDNIQFYAGNDIKKTMVTPKNEKAVIISIGYKNEDTYLGLKEINTGNLKDLELSLEKSSKKDIKKAINAYDSYTQENKINKDLEFMTLFAAEKARQEKLANEQAFMMSLWNVAFPCCAESLDSSELEFNDLDI